MWCKEGERGRGDETTKWHRACNLEALVVAGGGGGARVTGIMIHTHTVVKPTSEGKGFYFCTSLFISLSLFCVICVA